MSFTSGIIKQYLHNITVDIEDTSDDSKYFQIIDLKTAYPIGRHYFGIRGSLHLKPASEIGCELLDQQDQIVPIYLVNQQYSKLKGVATIGFEITASTIPGDLRLTITGVTRDNKVVRWEKVIV